MPLDPGVRERDRFLQHSSAGARLFSSFFDSSEKIWTSCVWSHDTFLVVPAEITDSSSWRTVSQGIWRFDEHITLLEMHALLRCVKASVGASVSTDLVCLGDNSG